MTVVAIVKNTAPQGSLAGGGSEAGAAGALLGRVLVRRADRAARVLRGQLPDVQHHLQRLQRQPRQKQEPEADAGDVIGGGDDGGQGEERGRRGRTARR